MEYWQKKIIDPTIYRGKSTNTIAFCGNGLIKENRKSLYIFFEIKVKTSSASELCTIFQIYVYITIQYTVWNRQN